MQQVLALQRLVKARGADKVPALYDYRESLFKAARTAKMQAKGKRKKTTRATLKTRLAKVFWRELERAMKGKSKERMSKAQMNDLVRRVSLAASKELWGEYKHVSKSMFRAGWKEVKEELAGQGFNIQFGGVDENAVRAITEGRGVADTFAGFGRKLSGRMNEVIVDAFKTGDVSPGLIVQRLQDEVGWSMRGRLETIARTETHKVWESAREMAYMQAEEEYGVKFLYRFNRHLPPTPLGNPQCGICTEVINRTASGVEMEELRAIIIEVSRDRAFGGNPKWNPTRDGGFPLTHPNCRHRHVRSVKAEMARDKAITKEDLKKSIKTTQRTLGNGYVVTEQKSTCKNCRKNIVRRVDLNELWHHTLARGRGGQIKCDSERGAGMANTVAEPDDGFSKEDRRAAKRYQMHGISIAVEYPRGSIRMGTSPDGKSWRREMVHDYGRIPKTTGEDGDQLDVYVGPNKASQRVYIVRQLDREGKYDENKVLLGFDSREEARAGYLAHYPDDWVCGPITEMTVETFRGAYL